MSPSTKVFGIFALLASSALAAPVQQVARDVLQVTDVEVDTEYVTQVVTVDAVPEATPTPEAAAPAPVANKAAAQPLNADIFAPYEGGHHPHPTAAPAPAPAPSTYAAPAPAPAPATSAAPAPAPATSAAPAPAPAASSAAPAPKASGNVPKRGLAFNRASLTDLFAGNSKIGWAWNWASTAGGDIPSGIEYVPMLWGTKDSSMTSNWNANAEKAIGNGASALMAFNEPDLQGNSNGASMTPQEAAAAYKTYMQPFAGRATLVSPSVTNGAAPMGLDWLSNFKQACDGCQIDVAAIHWYDSATNIEYFKNYIQQAHEKTGLPIWLSEFGATGSDDQISAFLNEAIPFLESQDYVQRYAYFMVGDGYLVNGNSLSSYGNTYATCA